MYSGCRAGTFPRGGIPPFSGLIIWDNCIPLAPVLAPRLAATVSVYFQEYDTGVETPLSMGGIFLNGEGNPCVCKRLFAIHRHSANTSTLMVTNLGLNCKGIYEKIA
jgi:hypothetical protein